MSSEAESEILLREGFTKLTMNFANNDMIVN